MFVRSSVSRAFVTVSVLALAAPGTALAQSADVIELETVVVDGAGTSGGTGTGTKAGTDRSVVAKRSRGVSKTATSLRETPQAVNVVTRDQIEAQGANSVAEALRYTPGVAPDPNGFDIRYDWLDVRGFATFGTAWLDGLILPGDPNSYAVPSVNAYALDRVEVIKGPASVLYGRSLPGGLVNLVSKRPQEETHREARLRTTNFGGVEGAVDMTGRAVEDGSVLYRFTGLAKNLNTQIDREEDRQLMLAPSLTFRPDADTNFTVYGYLQQDRPVFSPRFYPATGTLIDNPAGNIPRDVFLGDPTWGKFDRDFYAAGYEFEHRLDESWTLRQNLRYAGTDQAMDLVLVNPAFAYGRVPTTLNRVTAQADDAIHTFAVDNQAVAEFETGAFSHTALMGVDVLRNSSSTNFGNTGPATAVPSIDYLDPRYGLAFPRAPITRSALQKQTQAGFYAQDQIRYDRWLGTFGLRYDLSDVETRNRLTGTEVSTLDRELTGRAGLTYLFDNGIAPYVSYSTSFLPQLGTDRAGDPFQAQSAEQAEIGVKYEPPGGFGLVTVSLFDLNVENALTVDPVNTLFQTQSGERRVRGLEVEGKAEITDEIDLLAAYAYSDSEILRSGNARELGREILRLPEHQGSVWMRYRPAFANGLALSAGVRATSSYQTDSAYLPRLRIPDRTLVDIGAEYDFGALREEFEGTRLQVNVTNLTDERYVSQCLNATGGSCNYGAGRTINASMTYSW